jgi:hypothetical protein
MAADTATATSKALNADYVDEKQTNGTDTTTATATAGAFVNGSRGSGLDGRPLFM